MMRVKLSSCAEVVALLSLAFASGLQAVSISEEGNSMQIHVEAPGSFNTETVSVDTATLVKAPSTDNRQLLRSEKKNGEGPEHVDVDSHTQRLLEQRRAAREEEVAKVFDLALDGKWTPLTGLTVTQSSTLATDPSLYGTGNTQHQKQTTLSVSGTAEKAIDGNVNSAYSGGSCTHTKYEWKPWWEVILPQTYALEAVQITNRGDCCGEQCDICTPMHVLIDLDECNAPQTFTPGETKEIPCPMVGDSIKITLGTAEDYLMLCEVKGRGTQQALLEKGEAQCDQHSVLVQGIVTPNATDGRCITAGISPGNVSDALPPAMTSLTADDELEGTAKECEDFLLKSNELVEGADWQAHTGAESSDARGLCRLIKGRRVVGAEKAEGARCMRKLYCPQNMEYWKKKMHSKKRARKAKTNTSEVLQTTQSKKA